MCRFRQPGEIQQTQVSQGFAVFRLTLSRIPPRHSQSRRATNCATPRYEVRRSGWAYSPKPCALTNCATPGYVPRSRSNFSNFPICRPFADGGAVDGTRTHSRCLSIASRMTRFPTHFSSRIFPDLGFACRSVLLEPVPATGSRFTALFPS